MLVCIGILAKILTNKSMKMNEKFIKEIKVALEARRDELKKELETSADQVAENDYDAKFIDLGDKDDENAAEVAMFEKNLSMEKTLELSLYNVNKALKKIDEGTYGLCEKCGGPIKPERLQAFPSATACMKCKEKSL